MKQKEKEEELWSWGAGTEGQLGTTKLEDSHLPQLLPSLALPISQLACGGAHVIALTQGGGGRPCSEVLSWGRGTSGQLGHGDLENCLYPKGISFFERFVVSHVSAGWSHSGFVSGSGRVFTCGDGSFGQLGHGDFQSHCSPVEVLTMGSSDKHVEQIACGMRHSLVLLKGGKKHCLKLTYNLISSIIYFDYLQLQQKNPSSRKQCNWIHSVGSFSISPKDMNAFPRKS
ncbi:hypothetical protein GIB67_029218 [Kingdonia uniflora]|uniref:Uncharacterized protein n=1 Tax=Kingdonia uniflora TaxID=39325 RepID=A0A7J7NB10_9MAGN|nr:hypothetical protein GIB67_029218 [Kingdonia uniflora]